MAAPDHPGHIVFEDADADTRRRRPVDQVPDTIAWAQVDGRRLPVTRVVSRMRGDDRQIQCFGPDGALLSSTVQLRR